MTTHKDQAVENDRRNWYIGKEIPVAIIATVALQTAGIIWWAAGVSSDVRDLSRRMVIMESKVEQTSKVVNDGAAPAAVMSLRVDFLASQVNALRDQVEASRRHQ